MGNWAPSNKKLFSAECGIRDLGHAGSLILGFIQRRWQADSLRDRKSIALGLARFLFFPICIMPRDDDAADEFCAASSKGICYREITILEEAFSGPAGCLSMKGRITRYKPCVNRNILQELSVLVHRCQYRVTILQTDTISRTRDTVTNHKTAFWGPAIPSQRR